MRQRALIVLVVVLATLVTAGFVAVRLLTPRTQGAIVTWLIDQFGGRATVGAIQWSIRPHLQITAHDVQVMNEAVSEAPLVAIQRVTIETTVSDLLATPRRIGLVRLRGLVVRVPPRKSANSPTGVEPRANAIPWYGFCRDRTHCRRGNEDRNSVVAHRKAATGIRCTRSVA